MRLVGRIQLGPGVANTVGVYGVVAVPERSRLYCSKLHTPWLTVIDTSARKFVGIVPLEEQEQRGLMEMARHPLTGRTGRIFICCGADNAVLHRSIAK